MTLSIRSLGSTIVRAGPEEQGWLVDGGGGGPCCVVTALERSGQTNPAHSLGNILCLARHGAVLRMGSGWPLGNLSPGP